MGLQKGGNLLLTFEEFQYNMEGMGLQKDIGSNNMDEIRKSIWNEEELQDIGSGSGPGSVSVPSSIPQENSISVSLSTSTGLLEKQGSLTSSRTLKIDEVWRNISKEFTNETSSSSVFKEPTLGDDFFFGAGVVREETQLTINPTTTYSVLGDKSFSPCNQIQEFEFQQQPDNTNSGLMRSNLMEINPSQFNLEPYNLPLNINGYIASQEAFLTQDPKLGGEFWISDPIVSVTNQGGGVTTVAVNGSLAPVGTVEEEDIGNSKGNDGFVQPDPYVFNNEKIRGKRSSDVAAERKQRRMIKNRESAFRSRARKQAKTLELEANVANLTEENKQLKKNEVRLQIEKNKLEEEKNMNNRVMKRKCRRLRRTQTAM